MTLPEPRGDLGLREGYHSPQVAVPVRLNVNESPYPPPAEWLQKLGEVAASIEWNRYPDRSAWSLRRALGSLHGVGPEQVFAANGSNEVLQSLCLAYGGPGRTVAVFEPTYALHSHIAHLTGTGVVKGQRSEDFRIDPAGAAELCRQHRPVLTFVCSPNNPTGNGEDRSTVSTLLEATSGMVVVDEAYGQFADWSAVDLVGDDVPLVVTRTFSKTWSMAAARLGYLIGPAPVVENLERVVLPYHLDALKQAAGLFALDFVADMEARVTSIVAERQRLSAALASMPVTVWPSQANFVLFRPEERKGDEVWEGLVARGVLVRNTSSWPGLAGCLRVTVGTPEENDAFIAALGEIL